MLKYERGKYRKKDHPDAIPGPSSIILDYHLYTPWGIYILSVSPSTLVLFPPLDLPTRVRYRLIQTAKILTINEDLGIGVI